MSAETLFKNAGADEPTESPSEEVPAPTEALLAEGGGGLRGFGFRFLKGFRHWGFWILGFFGLRFGVWSQGCLDFGLIFGGVIEGSKDCCGVSVEGYCNFRA